MESKNKEREAILFSANWNNKLQCNYFTTLRLSDRFNVSEKYPVLLKKKQIGTGEIIAKKYLKLSQINDFIAHLDTGYNATKCKEILRTMYKNKLIAWNTQQIVLYLIRLERQNKMDL